MTALEFADWDDAPCKGQTTLMFAHERADGTKEAKAICAGCPHRKPCLQFAQDNQILYGVWGGQGPLTRRGLTRKSGVEHGTRTRYTYGCRCEPCRAANAEHRRLWRAYA